MLFKEKDNEIDTRKKTSDVRNGETYTLCVADTFLGDISGRAGKTDALGYPGHGSN